MRSYRGFSVLNHVHELISTLCPIHGVSSDGRIDFKEEATPQQRTAAQAIVDGWLANDQTILDQINTTQLTKLRTAAKQFHDDQHAQNLALRAVVKLVVDENNLLRQWMADFKAAVAAAGSLAALKTGVAGLPNVPQRTYQQAKTAINTLVDGE